LSLIRHTGSSECLHFNLTIKVKGKVTLHGAISTLRPPGSMTSGSSLFLPLTSSSCIHLQRRHASCRYARPLPVKVGTVPSPQFCHQSRNSWKTDGFFNIPQSWDIGHILLPFRRKAYWGFFWMPEKSDGFGRVWTRELGFQWPVC
jgi:hypothetical protein